MRSAALGRANISASALFLTRAADGRSSLTVQEVGQRKMANFQNQAFKIELPHLTKGGPTFLRSFSCRSFFIGLHVRFVLYMNSFCLMFT